MNRGPLKYSLFSKLVGSVILSSFFSNFIIRAEENLNSISSDHKKQAVNGPAVNNHRRLSDWVNQQLEVALEKRIVANISGFRQILSGSALDADHWGLPGAVIAAPSVEFDPTRINPGSGELGEWQDYRGVWKRDSALTMRLIFRLMSHGPWKNRPDTFKISVIRNYVAFSEAEQGSQRMRTALDWGRGGDENLIINPYLEPLFDLSKAKVNAFAQPNLRMWGEPQDDGPPLQIMALLDALQTLSQISIKNSLASNDLVPQIHRVIRRNLMFIMQTLPSTLKMERPYFERWEETKAQSHFAVLLEQRYALESLLVKYFAKTKEENFNKFFGYSKSDITNLIKQIEKHIESYHISEEYPYILAHFNIDQNHGLVRDKRSNLDVQVLMASLETNKFTDDESRHYLSPSHPSMRATFYHLDRAFKEKYRINKDSWDPLTGEKLRGVAWGRYPEDQQHFDGDPWFIATFTKVQFLLWDAIQSEMRGYIEVSTIDREYILEVSGLREKELEIDPNTSKIIIANEDPRFERVLKGMIEKSKETFFRAMIHAGHEGELSEVFDQNSGFKRGIKNLTWSWVELLKSVRMYHRASKQKILSQHVRFSTPENTCDMALEGTTQRFPFEI